MANGTQPEGARFDVGAAADEEADYGDGVAQVEEDDTCCDHTVGKLVRYRVSWEECGERTTHELKAVREARYRHPTMATMTQLTKWALTGTSS